MQDEYSLRAALESDREFLFRVYASTREQELRAISWSPAEAEAFLRMQFAAQDHHYRTQYDSAVRSVVMVDSAPAGRLYVAEWPREVRIIDISLLPVFRGRGVGERVLQDLIANAGARTVSLHVASHNPARRLYERIGFRIAEDREQAPAYLRMELGSGGSRGTKHRRRRSDGPPTESVQKKV